MKPIKSFWSKIALILSIVALLFANQIGKLADTEPIVIIITASIMAFICSVPIILDYLPPKQQKVGVIVIFSVIGLYLIMMFLANFIYASNTVWRNCIILYFVLSISVFVIRHIQKYGSLKLDSQRDKIDIIIWLVSSAILYFASFKIFVRPITNHGIFTWITYGGVVFIVGTYIVVGIIVLERIYKTAYIATSLSLIAGATLIFGLLPASYSLALAGVFAVGAIIATPLLCYICIKDIPNFDGTASAFFLMLIVKSAMMCYEIIQPAIL